MAQLNFDATNVAPQAPPEALETGWYPANIVDTEMKPTRNSDGAYLEVTNRVSAGPGTGRTLKARLNLQNKNQQAVDIAYSELSSICHAVGRLRVGDSRELHGGAYEIFVKKVERNDQPGVMTNEIAGYRAIGGQGSSPGFSGATGSQNGAAPSWANNQPAQQSQQQPAQQGGWQGQQTQQPAQNTQWQQPAQNGPAQNAGAPWQGEQSPQQAAQQQTQQPAQQNFAPQNQGQPAQQDAPPSNGGESVPPWAR